MSRDSYIQVRVSESEKDRIQAKANEADLSMSEFIRRAALDQDVSVTRIPKINREVWTELSGALSSLNQAVMLAQQGKVTGVDPEDFDAMYSSVKKLREALINQ